MTSSGHQREELAVTDCVVLQVAVSEAAQSGDGSRADLGQSLNTGDFGPCCMAGSTDFSRESGGQLCLLQPGMPSGDAGISLGVHWCSSWQAMEWRQEMNQGLREFCFPSHFRQSFILLIETITCDGLEVVFGFIQSHGIRWVDTHLSPSLLGHEGSSAPPRCLQRSSPHLLPPGQKQRHTTQRGGF